jgi:hypothetical protein
MRIAIISTVTTLLIGCGSGSDPYIAGFNPPALQPGFVRLVTPPVRGLTPGSDIEYCQWVLAPSDADQDVLAMIGSQSKTGHHAILFSTGEMFPVGETHVCTEDDMLKTSFLGAIGGEGVGGATAALPDGLSFRLRAGNAIMINTHWLNATQETVDGQAVIDVQFAPPSSDRQIADLFANNASAFKITPGGTTAYDVNCVLKQDLNFAMNANHMHSLGVSAYSELIRADGTHQMIVRDDTWAAEQQFNLNFQRFSVDAPLVAHKGDTYHTHCEWRNDGTSTIGFPTEMCAGPAFYFPGQGQLACDEGHWLN